MNTKNFKKTFKNEAQRNAQRAAQVKAKKGAEYANSNNGNNDVILEDIEETKPSNRKAYKMQPVYSVCKMAKAIFMRQLVQNTDTKKGSIKVALSHSYKEYPDALRFYLDFKVERDRLTDSKRFCSACEARGLNAEFVADHIVLEGKGVLESVLKEGIQIFGEGIMMFKAPLFEDTEGLYTSAKEGSDE